MTQAEATIGEWHGKVVVLSSTCKDRLLKTMACAFEAMREIMSKNATKKSIRFALRTLNSMRLNALELEDEDPNAVTLRSATFGLIQSLTLLLQSQADYRDALVETEQQTEICWVPDVLIDLKIPEGFYDNTQYNNESPYQDATAIGLPRLSEENDAAGDHADNQFNAPSSSGAPNAPFNYPFPLFPTAVFVPAPADGTHNVLHEQTAGVQHLIPPPATVDPVLDGPVQPIAPVVVAQPHEEQQPLHVIQEHTAGNEINRAARDAQMVYSDEDDDVMAITDPEDDDAPRGIPERSTNQLAGGSNRTVEKEKTPNEPRRKIPRAVKRDTAAVQQLRQIKAEENDQEEELPNISNTIVKDEGAVAKKKRALKQSKKAADAEQPKRKRGRPPKSASQPMKTVKIETTEKNEKKVKAAKAPRKALTVSSKKTSEPTTPKCVRCNMYPQSIHDYIKHLQDVHCTTPDQEQIYLTCSCGMRILNTKYNPNHNQCLGYVFTVLKSNAARQAASREQYAKRQPLLLKDSTADLVCVDSDCDFRSKNTISYVQHLRTKHRTNLFLSGHAFLCDCGKECLSEKHKCDIYNLRLLKKRDGSILTFADKISPRCTMCYTYPKTVTGYTVHLKEYHQKKIEDLDLFLKCSCGMLVHNSASIKLHYEMKCTSREFTLHAADGSELILAAAITH